MTLVLKRFYPCTGYSQAKLKRCDIHIPVANMSNLVHFLWYHSTYRVGLRWCSIYDSSDDPAIYLTGYNILHETENIFSHADITARSRFFYLFPYEFCLFFSQISNPLFNTGLVNTFIIRHSLHLDIHFYITQGNSSVIHGLACDPLSSNAVIPSV
jgi:hypothetical protein